MRPGMYIGKLGDGSSPDDGIYILIKEVLDNCIDEFVMGAGKTIEIKIVDSQVIIRDYGRGIPLGKVVDVVSKMNTGGKYDSRAFKKSVGLNGVGTKAVNALSSSFVVESVRDEQAKMASFSSGALIEEGEINPSKARRGTKVSFTPDQTIFKNYKFRAEYIVKMIKNYVYLNPGLTIDFNGEKPILTLPAVSVITFKIQEFNHKKKYKASKWVKSNGKEVYDYGNKFVLYGITSRGWVNKNGIDFNKITWFLYDPSEWLNMISEYVSLASGIDDKSIITSSLLNGKLVNGGIKTKKEFLISFKPLKEDMYVVSDYSDDMKLIYNEKTLGFFLKKTKNLVRINRKSLVSIYNFLFQEN